MQTESKEVVLEEDVAETEDEEVINPAWLQVRETEAYSEGGGLVGIRSMR